MLGVGVSVVAAEKVPVEVQRVIDSAMAGKYPIMLDAGFKLSDLTAGEPAHLYGFNRDSIEKLGENAPVSSVIKPLNGWVVPLLLHGKSKLLFLINLNQEGKWHVGGIGFDRYAKNWEKICQIWLESAGYHPIFVGHLMGQAYFYVPEKGDKNLTRFRSASHQSNNPDSLYANLEPGNIALKKIMSAWHISAHSAGGK